MSGDKNLVEYPEYREWNFNDCRVEMLLVAYAINFHIQGPETDAVVKINIPFQLHKDDHVIHIDPEKPEQLDPVVRLLRKPVTSLKAYRNGRLMLKLAEETKIVVEKHDQYESWEIHNTDNLSKMNMLCSPHDGPPWRE